MKFEEKILLLDDDERLLESMVRVFRKRFVVDTALRGDVALKKMNDDGPYAVVICDMKMPRMDGLEFIKLAKARAPDCIFMMLSGHASLQTAVEALNDGLIYKFFNKPISQDHLVQAIEEALQEYRLNIAKEDLMSLSKMQNQTLDVAEAVSHSIEAATHTAQSNAARTLLEIQEQSHLTMTPVWLKSGKASLYFLTSFDDATQERVQGVKHVLGETPEVMAKLDILMLGKIASYIFQNMEKVVNNKFVIDVHFATLYNRGSLEMYLRICRSLIETVRNAICFKIIGLPDDILPSRASDLIGRLRPFSSAILIEVPLLGNSERQVQGLSKVILVFDLQALREGGDRTGDLRRLFIALAHSPNRVLFTSCEEKQCLELAQKTRIDFYIP